MRASDIREILKVTAQPDVISLAGGLPAPELFPVDEYRRAFEWVLETNGSTAIARNQRQHCHAIRPVGRLPAAPRAPGGAPHQARRARRAAASLDHQRLPA